MDIYCPKCGEPYEIDELHDQANYTGKTFEELRRAFFAKGCGEVMEYTCTPNRNSRRAAMSAALSEIFGDDLDGLAATIEDFEALGL